MSTPYAISRLGAASQGRAAFQGGARSGHGPASRSVSRGRFILSRLLPVLLVAAVLLVSGTTATAEEKAGAADKAAPPAQVSDDVAKEALEQFKTAFKAKGRKGDEKIFYQDKALDELSKVQHRTVLEALFKASRHRTPEVRTSAVLYMGRQLATPGYAGSLVVKAMDKHRKDEVVVMAGLEALTKLQYRPDPDLFLKLLKHKEYSVQKHVLLAIGDLKDMRLLDDVFKMLKDIKASQGDSWDGVSVSVDTGTSGDGDQRAAERIGRGLLAKNKGKAKRGKASRDIRPLIEKALKALTGEEFPKAEDYKTWRKENDKKIEAEKAAIAAAADAQQDEAKRKGRP